MLSTLTTDPWVTWIGAAVVLGLLYGTLGRWIYHDATERGSEWAWQWATAIPFFVFTGIVPGLLLLIIYLQLRQDAQLADLQGSQAE